ncbi:MAG: MarR family transcriptional regulator [Pseudomonadales bacterium]|nr:MarR family transcriptional regulator [Pseudomonadales bacterium]
MESSDEPYSVVSNRLFFRLFQSANLLHKKGTAALDDFGVTTQQWSVLGVFHRNQVIEEGGISVGELTEYLLVSRQSLTGTLDLMLRKKYIKKVANPKDKRSKLIQITPKGRTLWNNLQSPITDFYQGALEGVPLDDQTSFLHYLNKVIKNMEAM